MNVFAFVLLKLLGVLLILLGAGMMYILASRFASDDRRGFMWACVIIGLLIAAAGLVILDYTLSIYVI